MQHRHLMLSETLGSMNRFLKTYIDFIFMRIGQIIINDSL